MGPRTWLHASYYLTNLGEQAIGDLRICENRASWGVAERHGGEVYLLYAANSTTIRRVRVGSDETTNFTIPAASDLCSFSLDLRRNRWVFHYEHGGDLGNSTHSETFGHCEMTFDSPAL